MQRFLVGPCIGGATLTKAAIEFIIKKNSVAKIVSFDDDGYGNVFAAYEDPNRLIQCDALYTEWYQHYCKVYNNTPLKDIEPNKSINLPLNSDIRDLVVMYMVSQNYDSLLPRDYVEELDRLNGGNPLRIVEVPDGYHCHISSDDELDHEYVQEFSRIWGADDDSESFTEQQIKRFSRIYEEGFRIKTLDQFGVGEYLDLLIAIKDDRAVVYSKLSKHFAFLKRNTYYTATNDHPKEWFEIIGNINHKYQTTPMFFTVESVNEYYDLVGKMMASISTREASSGSNDINNIKSFNPNDASIQEIRQRMVTGDQVRGLPRYPDDDIKKGQKYAIALPRWISGECGQQMFDIAIASEDMNGDGGVVAEQYSIESLEVSNGALTSK